MRNAIVALSLLVVAGLAGCATPEDSPDVMTTFYPLELVASRIANGTVSVGSFVPSGTEPHDWDPSPADIARAGGARLFVAQGAGFEPWLATLTETLGSRAPPLVYATANVPLRDAEDGSVDPHTWLDPTLLAQQASRVEQGMIAAFPEHADALRADAATLRAELDALDAEFAQGLATCEIDVVIANHDAYGYLAARHGFRVEAISGLSPEAEPSPEDVARAVEVAREHNITIIFFEELVAPRVAEVVAEEVGAQTRVLSPVEGLTPEQRAAGDDYFSIMRANLANLQEAMRCS